MKWKKPSLVFVNSMSDLFHEDVPVWFVKKVYDTMFNADWHIFQVLTKRIHAAVHVMRNLPVWPENVWLGATVENAETYGRLERLRDIPVPVKFVSFEPLLGPIPGLDLKGIDWVIAGGESGPNARPMKAEWVTGIQRRCADQGVPFFFKQWGGPTPKKNGRLLDGVEHSEMPVAHGDLVSRQQAWGSR